MGTAFNAAPLLPVGSLNADQIKSNQYIFNDKIINISIVHCKRDNCLYWDCRFLSKKYSFSNLVRYGRGDV